MEDRAVQKCLTFSILAYLKQSKLDRFEQFFFSIRSEFYQEFIHISSLVLRSKFLVIDHLRRGVLSLKRESKVLDLNGIIIQGVFSDSSSGTGLL